ncbi:P-loop containing nucleoside triphosphate hydrolase protein [Pisolithus albus]|nr:P-loop containing nucleoside triphosphate hydrolase protein [Pisolithus albus]
MLPQTPNPATGDHVPALSEIRQCAQERFGVRPCLWQLKVAEALLARNKDVVCVAGTGMGKTLGFWLPLLFRPEGIQIVVTPLNLLGKQTVASLAKAGVRGLAINSETATAANFSAIGTFQYNAIVISPEQMMKPNGDFERLLKNSLFASRVISIVVDEAHCLTQWGDFRPEYRELGRLRYILPASIPFMLASATLTKDTLNDTLRLLHMHSDNLVTIRQSSDRPNIKIGVQKMRYSLGSYADLAFLIPPGQKVGDSSPPKFLIFFDDIQDAIGAANYLRSRLPLGLQDKIKWLNSDMTSTFKEDELARIISGETWGLCTTDSFGMGMDVADIQLIIQWRATCRLETLWQRFGRAVRNRELTGMAVLFAEKDYFDENRALRAARKEKRDSARKRKEEQTLLSDRPCKRAAILAADGSRMAVNLMSRSGGGENDGAGESSAEEEANDEDQEFSGVKKVNGPHHTALGSTKQGVSALVTPGSAKFPTNGRQQRGLERRSRKVLDPGVDCLINAENRADFRCRRKVFNTYFNNTLADTDHLSCQSGGCARCYIGEPIICCDIHNPDEFVELTTHMSKLPPAPQRSRIPKYTWVPSDFSLRDALDDWREEKTASVYGWHHLKDIGPCILMTDETVDRIVDCAHYHKIQTLADLKKETGWVDGEQYGNEIIAIIRRHAPPPTTLFASTPLGSATTSTILNTDHSVSTLPLAKRANRCSACGQEGHNGDGSSEE